MNIPASASAIRAANVLLPLLCVAVLSGCATHHEHAFGTPYQNQLVSPGTQFAATPPAVQNTIRAQAGSTEIDRIEQHTSPAGTIYQVHFKGPTLHPTVHIAPDGSVLNPDLSVAVGAAESPSGVTTGAVTGLPVSELPLQVRDVINENAPGAEIRSVHKELWGERNIYIVSFKDARRAKLYVLSDGTLLKQGPQ